MTATDSMVLGRALERVDMTVRLLLSRVGDSASSPAWVTLLRSAGAHDTYLRTYRELWMPPGGRIHVAGPPFPRSILLLATTGRAQPRELMKRPYDRLGATAEGQRLLGRARSELEFCARACCWSRSSSGCRPAEDVPRRRRSVGAAVLSLRTMGGVARCGQNGSLVIEEGEV